MSAPKKRAPRKSAPRKSGDSKAVALANLLSLLIPFALKAYEEIRANHSELKPVEEILASADSDWDAVIATAQEELGKLKG